MDSEEVVNGFRWPGLPKGYLLKSFVSCLLSVDFVGWLRALSSIFKKTLFSHQKLVFSNPSTAQNFLHYFCASDRSRALSKG